MPSLRTTIGARRRDMARLMVRIRRLEAKKLHKQRDSRRAVFVMEDHTGAVLDRREAPLASHVALFRDSRDVLITFHIPKASPDGKEA